MDNAFRLKHPNYVNFSETLTLPNKAIEGSALHTRAACHRIDQILRSGCEVEQMREGIQFELDLDPGLQVTTERTKFGIVLPEWFDASYQNSKESSPQDKESSAKETAHTASSNAAESSISQRSTAFRDAWDRCDAIHLTQTMSGMSGRRATQEIDDARKARDRLAAELVATVSERLDTPFTEKQWVVIQRFAVEGRRLEERQENQGRTSKKAPLETVVQRLKERMPEVCDALMSECPRQARGQEWRYGKKGSLKVMVDGGKQGSFVNFETGEKGGVLQLIATQKQCDLSTAITWARQFVGDEVNHSKSDAAPSDRVVPVSKIEPKASRNAAPEALLRWVSRVPPQEALPPRKDSPELRKVYTRNHETARYTYTNAEGHPLFYVVRFEPKVASLEGASKMTLPLSYGMDVGSESPPTWRYTKYRAAGGEKTPLYNLQALQACPDKSILIVEGEKTAEAAQRLFPEMVVITWHGGAGAVHQSDWVVLKGRSVVIWADNDTAGIRAAEAIKEACTYAGARHVACVDLEFERGTLPQKWDLADALPDGVTFDDICGKITDALNSFNAQLKIADTIPVFDISVKAQPSVAKAGVSKDKEMEFDFELD